MKGTFVLTVAAVLLLLGIAEAVKGRKKLNRKREKLAGPYADMLHALDRMPEYGPSDTAAFLLGCDAEGADAKKALEMTEKEAKKIRKLMDDEKGKENEEIKKSEEEEEPVFPGRMRYSVHAEKRRSLAVRLSALEKGKENIESDLYQAKRCMDQFRNAVKKAEPIMSKETAEAAEQALKTVSRVFEKGDYANVNRDQAHNRIREKREALDEAMCLELRLDDIFAASKKA